MAKSKLDALKAVYQWVTRTMMKNQTGVMQTLPSRDLIELNTQITAQRLMQAGVDPTTLKNANQVENAINIIESRPVQEGIKSTKAGKVFDMEGQEIPQGSRIMGGKAVKETEEEIAARMRKENKEAAERIRKQKESKKILEDYETSEAELREKLKPKSTASLDDQIKQAYNKAVKEDKFKNVRLRDGRKIESEEDFREYIDELNEDSNFATGGRAGFANGSGDSGAPSIRLEPRASGMQTEQTIAPGVNLSERDINYGLTALLKGDKFYGGASLDKGKVKVDVETEDGKTLFKDSIGKDDAINFIIGMGQRDEGNKFEIKVDDDFENMNVTYKKTFAEGGRIGLKDGPDMPGRRKFMKIMGGIATLPLVGKFVKPAMPLIQKGAEITAPALDKIIQTVMSAGKLISQSGRRLKELTTKKKLKDVEVEEDMMDGPSYTIKTKDKTIYYRPGKQDEMGIEDDIIEVIEDTVTKKAGGGIARMLGE